MTIQASSIDPDSVKKYTINWLKWLEIVWGKDSYYETGTFVRPTVRNGYEYECTTAGASLGKEPVWPTSVDATVTDGTAVWTCRADANQALDTIASSYWSGTNVSVGDGSASTAIDLIGSVTPAAKGSNSASTWCYAYAADSTKTTGYLLNRIKTSSGQVFDRTLEFSITSK